MRKVVSLFLPFWPIERQKRRNAALPDGATRPIVTAVQTGNRRVVASACPAALASGITPGIALASAQAALPDLIVMDAEPEAEVDGLRDLAVWGLRYTPVVAPDPPDGLLFDITGADHLAGGAAKLVGDLLHRLEAANLTSRAGLAPTVGAAHALARHAGCRSATATDSLAAVLADMPIAALRLEPSTLASLRRVGFVRIGQIIDQPRAPLTKRYGAALFRRLDQALGRFPEPIVPVEPPHVVARTLRLAEPIASAESISRVIEDLVGDVCLDLATRFEGVRTLDLLCRRVDNDLQPVRVRTARATRDPRHLTRLLLPMVETIDPGFGIEAMTMRCSWTEPLGARQSSTLLDDDEPDLGALIDRIAARVGEKKIYRLAPAATDVPERSVRRVPALAPPAGDGWPADWPRPARLLHPPERAEVTALLPDYPPAQFRWRGINFRVKAADGPERVRGEWWLSDREMHGYRDYYQVDVDVGRFWLFRVGRDGPPSSDAPARWYVHGVFG